MPKQAISEPTDNTTLTHETEHLGSSGMLVEAWITIPCLPGMRIVDTVANPVVSCKAGMGVKHRTYEW